MNVREIVILFTLTNIIGCTAAVPAQKELRTPVVEVEVLPPPTPKPQLGDMPVDIIYISMSGEQSLEIMNMIDFFCKTEDIKISTQQMYEGNLTPWDQSLTIEWALYTKPPPVDKKKRKAAPEGMWVVDFHLNILVKFGGNLFTYGPYHTKSERASEEAAGWEAISKAFTLFMYQYELRKRS